jgi:glycosyl transferase family 25
MRLGAFLLSDSQSAPPLIPSFPHLGPYKGLGTFVLNLDRCTTRLHHIFPLAQALGFPVHRLQAIEGSEALFKYPQAIDHETYGTLFGKSMGPGTFGCTLSHIKAWQTFLASPYAFALILEDDVTFSPHLLRPIIQKLIQDAFLWDLCGMQLNHRGAPLVVRSYPTFDLVLYLYPVTGAGGTLINRRAAERMLAKSWPLKMPNDHFFTRTWELSLCFAGIQPRPITQGVLPSEIQKAGREWPLPKNSKGLLLRALWTVQRSLFTFFYALIQYKNKKWGKK